MTITVLFLKLIRFSLPAGRCEMHSGILGCPHKSPLDASSIRGAEQNYIRGFELYLARCEQFLSSYWWRFTSAQEQTRILGNSHWLIIGEMKRVWGFTQSHWKASLQSLAKKSVAANANAPVLSACREGDKRPFFNGYHGYNSFCEEIAYQLMNRQRFC